MEVPSNYTTFKVGFVNAQSGLRILKVEKKRLSDLKQKKTREFELAEEFSSLPALNSTFIQSNAPIERSLVVTTDYPHSLS